MDREEARKLKCTHCNCTNLIMYGTEWLPGDNYAIFNYAHEYPFDKFNPNMSRTIHKIECSKCYTILYNWDNKDER